MAVLVTDDILTRRGAIAGAPGRAGRRISRHSVFVKGHSLVLEIDDDLARLHLGDLSEQGDLLHFHILKPGADTGHEEILSRVGIALCPAVHERLSDIVIPLRGGHHEGANAAVDLKMIAEGGALESLAEGDGSR